MNILDKINEAKKAFTEMLNEMPEEKRAEIEEQANELITQCNIAINEISKV